MQSLGPVLVRVGFGLGPGLGWDFVLCGFWSGRVGLDRVRFGIALTIPLLRTL